MSKWIMMTCPPRSHRAVFVSHPEWECSVLVGKLSDYGIWINDGGVHLNPQPTIWKPFPEHYLPSQPTPSTGRKIKAKIARRMKGNSQ